MLHYNLLRRRFVPECETLVCGSCCQERGINIEKARKENQQDKYARNVEKAGGRERES